jgi:hypothetical protein
MAETIYEILDRIEAMAVPDEVRLPAGASSLDLLCAVYRDPTKPLSVRMRAAIAALPFEHPKLAVTAMLNGENFAAEIEAAMVRSGKALVIQAQPELPKP